MYACILKNIHIHTHQDEVKHTKVRLLTNEMLFGFNILQQSTSRCFISSLGNSSLEDLKLQFYHQECLLLP